MPLQTLLLDRLIVGTLMFFCLIIGTVYKSNLTAMLSMPRVVRPFDSLEELVESNVPFYFYNGSLVENAAQVNTYIFRVGFLYVKSRVDILKSLGQAPQHINAEESGNLTSH